MEDRTPRFAEAVIELSKKVRQSPITLPLIGQLVRAATSVGANYCEADDAISKKDFLNRIGICRKESRESKYWLRMIVAADPAVREGARKLWVEAKELNLIFSRILRSGRLRE